MRLRRRSLGSIALALALLAFGLEPLLLGSSGSQLPAWSHFWCSPAALRSTAHAAGAGGLGATLRTLLAALEVHWPHFIPILLGLATLIYLRRANTRYHEGVGQADVAHSPHPPLIG